MTLEQTARLTAVGIDIQGVGRGPFLVEYVGMPTDSLDGFKGGAEKGHRPSATQYDEVVLTAKSVSAYSM